MLSTPAPLQMLIEQIRHASHSKTPLNICGGNSKHFYGGLPQGEVLDIRPLTGISSYEPTELVVTARAGTPLLELEAELAQRGQCLAFEPPRFHSSSTVGGMVAAGLSGPARSQVGSVRDFVLGVTLLNGRAEVLTFGGQVMKNVAGYDVSRLMVGSLGVLGVLCEVSLKVLPVPPASLTLHIPCNEAQALEWLQRWRSQPHPLHASVWFEGVLQLRLSGAATAVTASARQWQQALGAEEISAAVAVRSWDALRDQTHTFFQEFEQKQAQGLELWRLSVPATAPDGILPEPVLVEWGGALRWYWTRQEAHAIRAQVEQLGGHATLYRSDDRSIDRFTPLATPLWQIHQRLKAAFDPAGIFNPGRLYRDL